MGMPLSLTALEVEFRKDRLEWRVLLEALEMARRRRQQLQRRRGKAPFQTAPRSRPDDVWNSASESLTRGEQRSEKIIVLSSHLLCYVVCRGVFSYFGLGIVVQLSPYLGAFLYPSSLTASEPSC